MLPLRLAWAWTVWKAQGQILRGKVIDLGPMEREHGLTYVAMLRSTRLLNIAIIGGVEELRFTKTIPDIDKVKKQKQEDVRLRQLVALTNARLNTNLE